MKRTKIYAISLIAAFIFTIFAFTNAEENPKFKYVGVKKCKMCHMSSKKGAQYKVWDKNKHSKAYETLASAESKKIAEEMGIDDPQKSDKCLKCHVTAYSADAQFKESSWSMEDGVGCESCHGPGSEYKGMKEMKNLSADKITPESVGLIMPTKELCVECHNEESPTYKEFKFEEMYKKVAHPMPEEYMKSKGYPMD